MKKQEERPKAKQTNNDVLLILAALNRWGSIDQNPDISVPLGRNINIGKAWAAGIVKDKTAIVTSFSYPDPEESIDAEGTRKMIKCRASKDGLMEQSSYDNLSADQQLKFNEMIDSLMEEPAILKRDWIKIDFKKIKELQERGEKVEVSAKVLAPLFDVIIVNAPY